MINRVNKGNRRQLQARKDLEAEGWTVYTARRGYKGQQIDIWGLWDHICYRNGYILLVQVKSNKCNKEDRERLEKFLVDGLFVRKELWIYKDYCRTNPWITKLRNYE